MNLLEQKEKRILWIVVLAICVLSGIISLISNIIGCFELWIDLPEIQNMNYNFYKLIQIFYTVSVALCIVNVVLIFVLKKAKYITLLVSGINLIAFIAFAIVLRGFVNGNLLYEGDWFYSERYELLLAYITSIFPLIIYFIFIDLAKIRLKALDVNKE